MTEPLGDDALAVYQDTLVRAYQRLRELGCDDIKQATPEQLDTVMREILAPLAGTRLTAKQIMRDHRELERRRKASQH
jgi:hypothetical protein